MGMKRTSSTDSSSSSSTTDSQRIANFYDSMDDAVVPPPNTNTPPGPAMCAGGCEYYGDFQEFGGYCEPCYNSRAGLNSRADVWYPSGYQPSQEEYEYDEYDEYQEYDEPEYDVIDLHSGFTKQDFDAFRVAELFDQTVGAILRAIWEALFCASMRDYNQKSAPEEVKPAKVVRCDHCEHKVRIALQFECRCGNTYCGKHRSPLEHNCTFNAFEANQQRLGKNSPVDRSAKLSKAFPGGDVDFLRRTSSERTNPEA